MGLTVKLVGLFALAALSHGYPATHALAPVPVVLQPDSYAAPVAPIPLGLQLPKEQAPVVPFYPLPPSETLTAPQYGVVEPNYYQAPVPSQDLVAPVETEWNPTRDPKFYYELPSAITKEELPTATFPKKYNKDIHVKSKPYSTKPKQEITLEPINEAQYLAKQKELQKTFAKLAKKENQKLINAEKEQQALPL